MAEAWLSIIGIGEDGLAGLSDGSRAALDGARHVFGGPRHLALAHVGERGIVWDVPFDVRPVLALRGQPVAVLASGDPFWFGAGGSICQHLAVGEWTAYPVPSTFSRVAAALGWRLEMVQCLGLHATPLAAVRPCLRRGQRLICLVRDGDALRALAALVSDHGYGASSAWALERLGGPHERIHPFQLNTPDLPALDTPVALAMDLHEGPLGLPVSGGLPDDLFTHDGQITKSPIRALTLRALAPRPGECLWDLGAGSGSVSVEWCLAGGVSHAVERSPQRAANIRRNAERLGVPHRLQVHQAVSIDALASLPVADAVFVGGGFDAALFHALRAKLRPGCRLVVNGVSLETEALLLHLQAQHGGELLQVALAQAQPLGNLRGWQPARPLVQWSVVL
ncbi:precorrin-6Y C5,15-methyltransferase (decarboxylating) subunit CbiT [Tepidimonas thermarum]|uniref:precorrin-6Y C5,15-methyltransferase (decarboxylating) subunit CbiT n=1 Tax=Tepidimonas thermarum TaxID=335431 RepID=UPI00117F1979|nr:precorrin-6Y C5,15-methyltransferase (decarboxylating) subunit CbiT [Tepidimonas thermarum]